MGLKTLRSYLNNLEIKEISLIEEQLSTYKKLLYDKNKVVNLVSRKTLEEDYWYIHILDSILPAQYFDFNGCDVLDFGTGGGLPGIPIKILFPQCRMYLLDSRQKKINAINEFIKNLDLEDCFTIVSRLEDLGDKWLRKFDYILCRSVKITPFFAKVMMKLLKKKGTIILYKSIKLDDISNFKNYEIIDVSHGKIGTRNLVKIVNSR